jgi:hypothetical protein
MKTNHHARWVAVALLAVVGTYGLAQSGGNGTDNPDWVEEPASVPPLFSNDHLIPIDMPVYVSLKVSVDPQTIVVGGDGVVRYVVVMANANGNTNAVYEGIRCITGEVKTYARWSASGTWSVLDNPAWKSLTDNMPSRHAQAIARQGGCQNRLATSKREIVDALTAKQPLGSKKPY